MSKPLKILLSLGTRQRLPIVAIICIVTFIALFFSLRGELATPMSILPVHAIPFSSQNEAEATEFESALLNIDPNLQGQPEFSTRLFENEMLVRFDVPVALGLSYIVIRAAHLSNSHCRAVGLPGHDFQITRRVGSHHITSLNTIDNGGSWLCRFKFSGSGKVSLQLHYAERFDLWAKAFSQKNFFVQGALLALALMSLLLSVLLASRMLLALFLWIVLTLHFLAIAGGWGRELYLNEIFNMSVDTSREVNFVAYFVLMSVLLRLCQQDAIHTVNRVVQLFSFVLGVLLFLPVSHDFFMMCCLSFIAASCAILSWCLMYNLRHGNSEKSAYLALALCCCLIGGVFQVMSLWVDLEYTLHVIGGRAVAITAAVMLILAVSDALNKNRKQKVNLLEDLKQANEELEGVFQLMPQAVFKLDQYGKLVKTNRVFDAINSQCEQDYKRPVLSPESLNSMRDPQDELVLHNRTGVSRYFKIRLADLPQGRIGVLHDVSAEKTKELAQFYQIIHDEESGAMNRMGLEHVLSTHRANGALSCHVVRILLLADTLVLSGGSAQSVSRVTLQSFSSQLRGACKFLGELVHLGGGAFCVLVKQSKEEKALNMLAEPRLWAQMKLQADPLGAFQVRVDALKLDLSNGSVDALQQVEWFASPSPLGIFDLADPGISPSVSLTPVAPAF